MRKTLRVATLNIHKGLSHFNRRTVIHGLRDSLRTIDADIVFLQEVAGLNERHALRFAGWPGEPQHEFLAGADWLHAYGRNRVHQYGHYGNAVLSRFRILSQENADVSSHRFEKRGLLHCVVAIPGWDRNLHCICVHLSLHERGRRLQLDAICERLEQLASRNLPVIVAGDFNDWRQRAGPLLARAGLRETFVECRQRAARTFPGWFPRLRLDRIYVRGLHIVDASALTTAPWPHLTDHVPLLSKVRL